MFWYSLQILQGYLLGDYVAQEILIYFAGKILIFRGWDFCFLNM